MPILLVVHAVHLDTVFIMPRFRLVSAAGGGIAYATDNDGGNGPLFLGLAHGLDLVIVV